MSLNAPKTMKNTYGTGFPDLKSLGLNLASTLLFILPFVLYFDRDSLSDRGLIYVGVVILSFVLAVLIPPMGWLRPHPYSDFPQNRGAARRN